MSELSLNELLFKASEMYDLNDIMDELDKIYKSSHFVFCYKIDESYLLSEIEKLKDEVKILKERKEDVYQNI
jgi:2-oxoglutarate dehydrogenase complex dehydrogenase (E1) component-like enzyme